RGALAPVLAATNDGGCNARHILQRRSPVAHAGSLLSRAVYGASRPRRLRFGRKARLDGARLIGKVDRNARGRRRPRTDAIQAEPLIDAASVCAARVRVARR